MAHASASIDLRTLAPLDVDTIVRAAERCGRVVVVHEAPLTGGFGAEVVATLQEEAFYSLEAPIRRVAGVDVGSAPPLVEDWCRPDVARSRRRPRRVVRCLTSSRISSPTSARA